MRTSQRPRISTSSCLQTPFIAFCPTHLLNFTMPHPCGSERQAITGNLNLLIHCLSCPLLFLKSFDEPKGKCSEKMRKR
ncbi:hypothetical protein CDAR_216121 [Caerostris darwini]|uniref:Uncharacterized protein n=1 Tax=Caerostris darwini TaxID=1538125 RepID=A0AAV4SQY9_9ARAC|nr:hypothetical protein CDAR_216121 [Caerostris darwini]